MEINKSDVENAAYNADSIRILTEAEINEKFGWRKVGMLAQKYNKPVVWIVNGLEACRRCGLGPDYFIGRYLEHNMDIPKNKFMDDAFREVLKEQQETQWELYKNYEHT